MHVTDFNLHSDFGIITVLVIALTYSIKPACNLINLKIIKLYAKALIEAKVKLIVLNAIVMK